MNNQPSSTPLVRLVVVRYLAALLVLSALFFLSAGTAAYWEAWVYLTILFVPMLFVLFYLLKNDPDLLARRMKTRETDTEQRRLVKLSYIPFLLAFLLPGFDKRFGWSAVPVGVVIAADLLVLLGYGLVFLVFKENRFASRIVEVAPGQTVIQTGPYAWVRHPMYVGALLFYVLSPLALGSYWAMLPAALIIPVIVARLLHEETVLARDLPGYQAYMQRTRDRLVPGIW